MPAGIHFIPIAVEQVASEDAFRDAGQFLQDEVLQGEETILLVDDEEMIINMAGRILARLGYESAFARNGSEAVALYEEALKTEQPFDAVVLDLTVRGGMGGEEAMRHLLEIDPQAKVIVSSGYSDSPVMQNYKQYGFSAATGKPYSLIELSQALDRVLNPSTAM